MQLIKFFIDEFDGFKEYDYREFKDKLKDNPQQKNSFLKLAFYGSNIENQVWIFCTSICIG